jgi:WD40 repeat protein
VLVLCLVTSGEPGQAVRPERSHLLLENGSHVESVVFSPRDLRLAWSNLNGTVATLAWEVGDGPGVTSDSPLDCGGVGRSLAFSADGSLLAVGLLDGKVMLWDSRSWSARTIEIAPGLSVRSAAFAPDRAVMAASAEFTITIWDLISSKQRSSLQGHRARVVHLCFSPDGQILASSDAEGQVILWDWSTGRRCATLSSGSLTQHHGSPLAFLPEGKTLAFANNRCQIVLCDVATGKQIAVLGDRSSLIIAMAVSADGNLLMAGRVDGLIECWDLVTHALRAVLREHESAVRGLAFSPDGRQMISAGTDGTLRSWNQGDDFPSTGLSRR